MALQLTRMFPAAFRDRRVYRGKEGEKIVLRPATREDAPELTKRLARVVKEGIYLDENPDNLPTHQEKRDEIREIHRNKGMYTVVEVEGKIAGAALLRRGSKGISDHTAKFRTWLVPGYRGMGLGKKLMEYTIDWAHANGLEKINLDVWSSNNRAIQLYKKYGFRVEGRLRRQAILQGKYVDEVFMSLFL
jgi:RimJ/RimL family protein N-acetyltransferase